VDVIYSAKWSSEDALYFKHGALYFYQYYMAAVYFVHCCISHTLYFVKHCTVCSIVLSERLHVMVHWILHTDTHKKKVNFVVCSKNEIFKSCTPNITLIFQYHTRVCTIFLQFCTSGCFWKDLQMEKLYFMQYWTKGCTVCFLTVYWRFHYDFAVLTKVCTILLEMLHH
jgi:hypothetical protein